MEKLLFATVGCPSLTCTWPNCLALITPTPTCATWLPAAEAAAQAARVAQLQREAEARRDQAGTFEMQAERKKTEAQTVVVPAVDEAELRRKAEVGSGHCICSALMTVELQKQWLLARCGSNPRGLHVMWQCYCPMGFVLVSMHPMKQLGQLGQGMPGRDG